MVFGTFYTIFPQFCSIKMEQNLTFLKETIWFFFDFVQSARNKEQRYLSPKGGYTTSYAICVIISRLCIDKIPQHLVCKPLGMKYEIYLVWVKDSFAKYGTWLKVKENISHFVWFSWEFQFNYWLEKTKPLNVRPSLRYRQCATSVRPGSKIKVKIINLMASIAFLLVGITFL